MKSIITLTTDFGLSDAYVGVMKGVILGIAPDVVIVDLCHEVAPQDIIAAHFLLACAYEYFPQGTIHVAVVDPGVGTRRRPLALAAAGHYFVGPDNGLFSFVHDRVHAAICLTDPAYWLPAQSNTFHGRDIFAPVAAHLARAVPITRLGDRMAASDLMRLDLPQPRRQGRVIEGVVIHVDRFGNLVTNIAAAVLPDPQSLAVTIGGQTIHGLQRAYGDAQPGQLLAVLGSSGLLEIAVSAGNAARELAAGRGAPVQVMDRI